MFMEIILQMLRKSGHRRLYFIMLLSFIALLAGCARPQPSNIDNICSMFRQYPDWYWATKDTERRWKMPPYVQMAIIHQESSFKAKAQPERTKILWVIPWTRPSTSYGYSQALASTWQEYQKAGGGSRASRSNFADTVDFIGWYGRQANRRAGIATDDAYSLYLAYHEGVGGFMRKTYRNKQWLISVAKRVGSRSKRYQTQLAQCEKSLTKKPWYRFW